MSNNEAQDLTDQVFLLRESLENGKVKIAEHLWGGFSESLAQIKLGDDGLVIPITVDSRIRAISNGLRYFSYREETKKSISLARIQEMYFQFLDVNFGHIRKAMLKGGADANAAGHLMARDAKFVAHFAEVIGPLISDLEEFWRSVGDAAMFHIEDSRSLKAVFGGDLFPSYRKNLVSTAGLYVDTIILPCPILHSARLIRMWKPEKAAYYVVKHAVNALGYRDLALADVNPPIVAVLPDLELLDDSHIAEIQEAAKSGLIRHGYEMFGVSFTSIEELSEFLEDLATPEDVVAKLTHPGRLLFDTDWTGTPKAQIERSLKENSDAFDGVVAESHAGRGVFMQSIGRMSQAAAIELRSSYLGGTPLIDAETSWQYLNWKMEYEARSSVETEHPSAAMHVVRALQAERDKNLCWLGNVPTDSIIELRKRGLTEEVRSILSKGVPKLIEVNPTNFFRTSDQVVDNLDSAFRDHQRSLIDARDRKLKLYGLDVSACLAFGGIAVAAAITANPVLGSVAGILGVSGLPNLREIKTKFKDLREREKKMRTSPTGILFKHLK